MWSLINKAELVKRGVEALEKRPAGGTEAKRIQVEIAQTYAALAKALGDDTYYGE